MGLTDNLLISLITFPVRVAVDHQDGGSSPTRGAKKDKLSRSVGNKPQRVFSSQNQACANSWGKPDASLFKLHVTLKPLWKAKEGRCYHEGKGRQVNELAPAWF